MGSLNSTQFVMLLKQGMSTENPTCAYITAQDQQLSPDN